jgi:hypothetical protein
LVYFISAIELFNLLVNPSHTAFALPWHRDDVRLSASTEEEQASLAKRQWGIQWNTALLDDNCLFVVPGTHSKILSEEQRSEMISSVDETKKHIVDEQAFDPLKMPRAINVPLRGTCPS